MKKKKSLFMAIALLVLSIVIIAGSTYAYYIATINNDNAADVDIKTRSLGLHFTDGAEINLPNALPGVTVIKKFSVTNTGTESTTYSIYINDLVNEFTNTDEVVYELSSTNGGATITETAFPTNSGAIASNIEIPIDTTQEYTMTIRYINTNSSQNIDMGKQLSGVIQISEEEAVAINLYDMMATNALNTTIDFSANSATSGTHGIYTTTATEGSVPVYYYRGDADKVNNNVIFNNMCWKIIRTTETGGVKLIYNGTPTNGECTSTGSATEIGESEFNIDFATGSFDNAYVGYMYGTPGSSTYAETHANTNNSTIKTYIDSWFNTNFNATTIAKLEDTVFCNDRSTTTGTNNNTLGSSYGTLGYKRNATGYGALARAYWYTITPNPSLVCPNDNDKFTVSNTKGNGALTYPVGLITLDEVVLAGYNTSGYNAPNSSYYYNPTNYLHTGETYWTFSPVSVNEGGNASVGLVFYQGCVERAIVRYTNGVRPVVSLSDGTTATGEGTTSNPYVVE